MFDKRVSRIDETRLSVANRFEVPTTIFANEAVPLERKAIDELLGLLEVQATLEILQQVLPESYPENARLERVILTPDLHKAQGIPVGTVMQTTGFVIPQAMGNDINCGMRLHKTNLRSGAVLDNLNKLEKLLRHLFFEGGRRIPMTGLQRRALMQNGLMGLLDAVPKTQTEGLWHYWHDQNLTADLERTEQHGSLQAHSIVHGLEDWIGDLYSISRDAQIGSLGGGNHFAEIQRVAKILDPVTAHAWGLKPDHVVVMVHSGSVGVGHLAGSHLKTDTRAAYPKGIPHPENGIYPMPLHSENWHDPLANAANFAFANRMFLALMVRAALEETVGATDFDLLYDAPHNLVWQQEHGALHRKGATPAKGFEAMQNTPFAYHGEPVLIPGSMGASSYVLAGTGNPISLESASHGAGRIHSRGEAMRGSETEFKDFLERYRVVTPLDWHDEKIKARPDIVREHLANLRQEAPFAYKGITSIIETQTTANMVRGVVELEPLVTVKG
jgi:tRNA-splicing ligase RtcB (3'-phosphate/5'-hydroxy nucleic acid ligase)